MKSRELEGLFCVLLASSLAESAWHVRSAFSASRFLQDWLPHFASFIFVGALFLVITKYQKKPDRSFVRLNLTGDGSKTSLEE